MILNRPSLLSKEDYDSLPNAVKKGYEEFVQKEGLNRRTFYKRKGSNWGTNKMKRENFKFSMVPNIPANAEFFYRIDPTITCKRIGNSENVKYNGGIYSLSGSAQAAYRGLYGKNISLCGPMEWLYNGKTLNEWRIENEQKKADELVAEHTVVTKPSIKEVVDFIENYPVCALKNWGDAFYGYPEEILEEMWGMVDGPEEEKLKKKILVLDDFGLQVHRFMIKKGISPENIYFCISDEDEGTLGIVKAVYSKLPNSEKICSILSLRDVFRDNMLVIMNPPYGHSLHAKITKTIFEMGLDVLVLCPESLLSGNSQNCVQARNVLEGRMVGYEFKGTLDFGDAKPVCSIFHFVHNTENRKVISFEDARNQNRTAEEISIREKVLKVERYDVNRLSKTYNFTTNKRTFENDDDFMKFVKEKIQWGNPKRVFVLSTSALYYGEIIQKDEPSYVAGYFEFRSEDEAEVFRDLIQQPLYNQLLKMYSTNRRDLCPKTSEWPKSLESLHLTQKEIDFLNSL